jgi:hypothetical protein
LYEDSVQNERGEAGILNRIHVHYDVSFVVPIFHDGSLLMIRKYYHGANTTLLGLPGGLIMKMNIPRRLPKESFGRRQDSIRIQFSTRAGFTLDLKGFAEKSRLRSKGIEEDLHSSNCRKL